MKIRIAVLAIIVSLVFLTGCTNEMANESVSSSVYSDESESINYDELDFKVLERLAKNGDSEAAFRLGRIYEYGTSNKLQSFSKAFYWYKISAEEGNPLGDVGKGYMYLNGCGVKMSVESAYECFEKALDAGISEGYVGIARCELENKEHTGSQRKAYEAIVKAYEDEECLDAAYYMAYLYEQGIGTTRDYEKALSIYDTVGDNDSDMPWDRFAIDSANTRLGIMHLYGNGVKKNPSKAMDYLEKAAQKEYAMAMFYIGALYESGFNGDDPDYDKAMEWYRTAAMQEYAPALNQMGCMYSKGLGVDVDYEQALYYQQMAALQGYVPAWVNLGYLYENGLGTEKNFDIAKKYYTMAEKSGYEGASTALDRINVMIDEAKGQLAEDAYNEDVVLSD